MNFSEFQEQVITDGIEAAKVDYAKPEDKARLEGSIKGFEDCRGKTPAQLLVLLIEMREEANQKFINCFSKEGGRGGVQLDEYWFTQCRVSEIEWVCNTVSAMLINQGLEPIITPTCRGTINAARIIRGT